MDCYCCAKATYANCCEPFIMGFKKPKTALQLMQSRYTAFCIYDYDYLKKTVTGKAKLINISSLHTHKWIKLDIINTTNGREKDVTGTVQFNAFFKEELQSKTHFCLSETSQFKKINNLWFYTDGNATVTSIPTQ